jgi:hypothetical protein
MVLLECFIDILTSFRRHYGPGSDSACNINEYQEYFLPGKGSRCVGLTPSCTDCLIWEPQSPGALRVCSWPVQVLLFGAGASCLSVCLSVCLSAWNKLAPTGRIFMTFRSFFQKSVEKIQVSLTSDKNNGYFT